MTINSKYSGTSSNVQEHSFKNRLLSPGTPRIIRQDVSDNLNKSIKYFENRIKEYEKAIKGAKYFLKEIHNAHIPFDDVAELYWRIAFDPCTTHAANIFLSLDSTFEALRDRFINIEIRK